MDTLSERAGLHWEAQPEDVGGPIVLPSTERDRIIQRFERLREQLLSRFDQEPEHEEFAGVLDDAIERLGRKHEALAVRMLTRRFPDPSGAPVDLPR